MKTKFTSFYLIIDLLLIAAITIYISFAAGLWNGYPIGTDAYAHLSKLQFMFDAWPHFEWNSLWANGMPMFLWYSIVPYLIMLVGKFVFGSLELSMQICAVAAILLMAVSIFLIVHHASRSRLASWLSALILLSMPALWGRIAMGEIPRLLATAFLPLAWYMVIRYLSSKKPSYILHFCTIIVVALSLSGHYIMTGLTVVSLLLIILIYVDYRQIWSYLVKLILPALLLAAFTLLPFLTTSGLKQVYGTGLFGGDTIQPFTNFSKLLFSSFPLNSRLDWINADYGNSLHWLVLPLFILFIFLSLHRRDKYDKDHHEYAEWRVIKSFLYLSGLFVAYGFAMYVGYPRNWYNAALPPADAFYFLSLSLPIVIGLGFHFGIKKNIARIFVFLISIGLIAMVINHLYPWPNFLIKQNDSYRYFNQEHTVNNEFNDTLSASDHNSDYRWAHNNSNIAIWFNYDYQMPQTRDYFSQALLNQDDKFWFENSVFALSDNYTETKYLLDWFAVKYLSVSYPNFNFAKFDQNDDLFKPIASNQNNDPNNKISTYEYLNPSPILSATNAKSILIIGDSSSYHNFMLSLSGTDYDSSYIIPVQGEQTLDLYSLDELQKFDAVMLYNFNYLEKERAFNLLDQYVSNGGSLLVESAAVLSKPGGEIAFLPLPVTKIQPGDFGETFDLKINNQMLNSENNEQTDFGPAVYGDDLPWSMLYSEPADLRSDAYPIVTNHDKVIVAGNKYGQGQVVWSGYNMFYHYNNFHAPDEKEFIIDILAQVLHLNGYQNKTQNATITDPSQREIVLDDQNQYSGILLKENYFPAWGATINGRTTKIYPAGPNMMYIPLSQRDAGAKITFVYHYLTIQIIATAISGLYLSWLVYSLLWLPHFVPPLLDVSPPANLIVKPLRSRSKTSKKASAKKKIKKKQLKK